MKTVSSWLIARLTEPSTYAGAALVATSVQGALATGEWKALAASILGALAMLLRDKGATA